MRDLPESGVGMVCLPGLETFIEANKDVIDVIEIEPQPLWFKSAAAGVPYAINTDVLAQLCDYPHPKLVHGVGFPIGGSVPPEPGQVALFVDVVKALDASWASEHLSFSRASGADGVFNTGFLLPPLQSAQTVALAAANIRSLSAQLPVPFAFETGVNYLQPVPGEMSDGAFFGAIAEEADCAILLDMHNLWCNERNGRQGVLAALDDMPLERVCEVHLAGGEYLDGYYLDAHSGLVPAELMQLAHAVLPRLPNLKALVFEIVPAYMPAREIAHHHLTAQLHGLRRLWDERKTSLQVACAPPRGVIRHTAAVEDALPSPPQWERALAGKVLDIAPDEPCTLPLDTDEGIRVLRQLVAAVRSGTIVDSMTLSYRLISLTVGERAFLALLHAFWKTRPPEPFATEEALNFAEFLRTQALHVPHLDEVLAFELASHQVRMYGLHKTVRFTCSPLPLLMALRNARMPDFTDRGEFALTIGP
ncbi:multinuclear nonheme iron-dependent oxidase [Massilia antarctica]|uniref:multinuclear nonheme iron-dependent oxidase n=1 Tax=Massilia antarctica TaxID=2765360 RepID=UPI0006BB5671|nr:DUF692 family multinuclear iron-containing protein [Massilia sp. H27-R4]MCY0910137.1 DUF692 family protein [Massilia sp. H27-R4]CUI02770.1 Uncharacterized protein conserved in bacteria, NMA0228-like [Janthinobacterium sp. CG23_2]CUU26556.1 Uncharacterized protein conserved in bacteria, NMA0228-like [Janthinobacterium sp. CG23_2]